MALPSHLFFQEPFVSEHTVFSRVPVQQNLAVELVSDVGLPKMIIHIVMVNLWCQPERCTLINHKHCDSLCISNPFPLKIEGV